MAKPVPTFWSALLRRDVLLRGVKFSLVVGTLLVTINHADALLSGDVDTTRIAKILLTYCVPFGVTVVSSAQAIVASATEDRSDA